MTTQQLGAVCLLALAIAWRCSARADTYQGRYIAGEGDTDYLASLDAAYEMMQPSARMANLPILYAREWNGFVEGPTWGAWWSQNSFGPSYTMMPFFTEPYRTWLANSQALWFAQIGDGKRKDNNGYIAPDGCLCDAAAPGVVYYRQGDGNVAIHDWCIGFTAADLINESERLLITRDKADIARRLPDLERVAAFLDSRRDPKTNLLLGGVASDLLAPSYGGWLQPDGSRAKAYLSELSVNYVAGLTRLAEVCKLAGQPDRATRYLATRDLVRHALPQLVTGEGYFVEALNPDGTRQGVYGAPKHGYFTTAPNHDAMCFRVVDDAQARRIYDKIRSIPMLRPFDLILPNYPSYDNMYESRGLFEYGTWVNGGEWTTAEARMMMGYFRVGAYADARAAFQRILHLARAFRADNPLTGRGSRLYQPGQPYNVVYDCWGAPGALLRGLFEYEYTAEGIRLYPHIPPGVTRLEQRFPVLFGRRRLYVSVRGSGPLTGATLNGKPVSSVDGESAFLRLDDAPGDSTVELLLGGAAPSRPALPPDGALVLPQDPAFWRIAGPSASRSGNSNPLRIGMSPGGTNGFVGEMKRVRIWRRALTDAEVAAAARGGAPGARPAADYRLDTPILGNVLRGSRNPAFTMRWVSATPPGVRDGGLHFDGASFLEAPASDAIDFQGDFTIDLWARPAELPQGGARLVDHCTVGAADGYNLDLLDAGRTLRLITVFGAVQGPVELQPGEWRHIAATCTKDGAIRLYLDGTVVAGGKGNLKPTEAATAGVDLKAVGRFYALAAGAGLKRTYAAEHAALVIRCIEALQARRKLQADGELEDVTIPGVPPAVSARVDRLYVETIRKLTDGLCDWLQAAEHAPDETERKLSALARRARLLR